MSLMEMYKGMVNSPDTTITETITSAATTITVADGAAIPDPPNILVIGGNLSSAETVKLISKVGNVLTVERGLQGVSQGWGAGTVISRNFTEYDYESLRNNTSELINYIGSLPGLSTEEKTNLVAAINEINTELGSHKVENIHLGRNQVLKAESGIPQSIPSGIATKLTLVGLEIGDIDYFTNSKLIIRDKGVYMVSGIARFEPTTTGAIRTMLYKNGLVVMYTTANNALYQGYDSDVVCATLLSLNKNDYIELYAAQFSGSAAPIIYRELSIVRVA